MKKLFVLIALLLVSFKSFSQTDTIVSLKQPIAKLVIKDLVSYDGLKIELRETLELLRLERQKVEVKDSVVFQLERKAINLQEIINKTNEQYNLEAQKSLDLFKELKSQRRTTKFYKITSTVGIIAIGVLLVGGN